jgi:hypothetical protein
MQPLPAWGKRDLRRDVARADAAQAASRANAWSDLAMRIKSAFAQYYVTDGSAHLTAELLDLMSRLEQIARPAMPAAWSRSRMLSAHSSSRRRCAPN